jgi:hypothetical protein
MSELHQHDAAPVLALTLTPILLFIYFKSTAYLQAYKYFTTKKDYNFEFHDGRA